MKTLALLHFLILYLKNSKLYEFSFHFIEHYLLSYIIIKPETKQMQIFYAHATDTILHNIRRQTTQIFLPMNRNTAKITKTKVKLLFK